MKLPVKPCPFCGSASFLVFGDPANIGTDVKLYSVDCGMCIATGPFGSTIEDAIIKWNNRPDAVVASPNPPHPPGLSGHFPLG